MKTLASRLNKVWILSLPAVVKVGDLLWNISYCNPLLFRCGFNFGNFGTSIFYLNFATVGCGGAGPTHGQPPPKFSPYRNGEFSLYRKLYATEIKVDYSMHHTMDWLQPGHRHTNFILIVDFFILDYSDFPRAVLTCIHWDSWGSREPPPGKMFKMGSKLHFLKIGIKILHKKLSKAFNLCPNRQTCVPGREKPSVGKTLD